MLKILNYRGMKTGIMAITACFVVSIVFVNCKGNDTNDPTIEPSDLKGVYVAGNDGDGPKLWIDGAAQNLTDGWQANSVYVSGEDVYVAGSGYDGNAKLWKNGTARYFSAIGNGFVGVANSVFVQ